MWSAIGEFRLSYHLIQTHAIPSLQSAYQRHRSTETTLLRIHSDLCSSIDSGNDVISGSLDMSAAFNTVDHTILLSITDSLHLMVSAELCLTGSLLISANGHVLLLLVQKGPNCHHLFVGPTGLGTWFKTVHSLHQRTARLGRSSCMVSIFIPMQTIHG